MIEHIESLPVPLIEADCMWVEALYIQYSSRVYRFIYYRLGNRESTEDLTALVFQRAIENCRRYDRKRGSEAAWLFTIARRALIDYIRRHRATAPLDETENLAGPQSSPHELAELHFELKLLRRALKTLSERELNVLSLKYAGGLTGGETAKVLGLSEKNVGVILSRARKKLREQMEEEWK